MISILFATQSHYPVNRDKIRNALTARLGRELTSDAEISISIVGDRRMRQLNRLYRKIDASTDVLSFPLNDSAESAVPFVNPPDKVLYLGDIVISYPQALDEARINNCLVDDMIARLALHGLEHLM